MWHKERKQMCMEWEEGINRSGEPGSQALGRQKAWWPFEPLELGSF